MGGFRYNGCGVTDHFKHIKSLGVHNCPNCKKPTEFTLDEANQKIDVFWIPTLTLKSRYAVMCKKCKNGQFCSTEWAGYLMNQAVPDVIFEDAARQQGASPTANSFKQPEALDTPAANTNNGISRTTSDSQTKAADSNNSPNFFKCSYCGVTQMREGDFCAYCGKPAPKPDKKEGSPISGKIVCPSCKSRQAAGSKFCSQCGRKMEAEQPANPCCPNCGTKITAGMLFCMECGARLT